MPSRLLALSSSLVVLASLCGVARAHAAGNAVARATAEPTAWTSYANDNQLRNSTSSSSLTRQSVPRLASTWTAKLDGAVFATITVGGSILGADTKGTAYAFRPAPFRGSPLLSQGALHSA